jgi:prepilin-type N-terminal cleavage/methylation domain-containing protein
MKITGGTGLAMMMRRAPIIVIINCPREFLRKEIALSIRTHQSARGFTVLETTIVVLIVGVIAAFATPKIINGMRQYRVSMAVRQMSDLIQRAKTEAVNQNRNVTLRVNTATNQAGLVIRDAAGTELSVQYVPLPEGVRFVMPSGTVPAPMTGAPTTSPVSFPAKSGSTTIFEQDFNSRGFPAVNVGAIHAIYIGSYNKSFAAVTLNHVGGLRSWSWNGSQWLNTRTGATGN